MKKSFILFLILFLVFGCSKNNVYKKKLNYLNNIDKNIDYFNYDYIDRYIRYKNNNLNLDNKDIITRVNIGLDNAFYANTKESNYLNNINILVNKYTYVPRNYKPENLVLMHEYSKENIYLVSDAYKKFVLLADSALKQGLNIRAISAYRDVSYQENLYSKYSKNDSLEIVDTYSARPGYSEHHTGLAIDVDNINTSYEYFEYTDEYEWMINNSYKYGFILRYPKSKEDITGYKYESWHFRYVGKKAAKYIHRHNITYDEYFVRFIENKKGTSF